MRCGKCGASSRVLYTTELGGQFMTRRRRECDNLHRFNTYEVHTQVMRKTGHQELSRIVATLKGRVALYQRDLRVWLARVVHGNSRRDVAKAFGLKGTTVSAAVRRMQRDRDHLDEAPEESEDVT